MEPSDGHETIIDLDRKDVLSILRDVQEVVVLEPTQPAETEIAWIP